MIFTQKRLRFLSILILLAMAINLYVPAPVDAVAPLILAPEAITVIAGLATAAGITFASNDAARAYAYKAYNSGSAAFRATVNDVVAAGNWVVSITAELWNEIHGVDAPLQNLPDGVVTVLQEGDIVNITNAGAPSTIALIPIQEGFLHAHWTLNNAAGNITFRLTSKSFYIMPHGEVIDGTFYYYLAITEDIDGPSRTIRIPGNVEHYQDFGLQEIDVFLADDLIDITVNGTLIAQFPTTYKFEKWELFCGDAALSYVSSQAIDLTLGEDYTKDVEFAGNPSWDLTGQDVVLPDTLEEVVGKTADEVVTDATTTPTVTLPDTGTDIGWLDKIFNSISNFFAWLKAFLLGLVDSLVNAFRSLIGEFIPKIPDGISMLFVPLLSLILAIIALFVKGVLFVTSLYAIQASSSMLNADIISGITFARQLSHNGITLYGMIIGCANLMLGLMVFALFKKLVFASPSASHKRG